MTTFWLAAPLLAIGFIAGIVISLVQIATSIQDNAFSSIPAPRGIPGGAAAAAAVDAAEDDGLHGRAFWETWGGMPASLTLSLARRCSAFCWCWRAWAARSCSCRCRASRTRPQPARVALALGFTLALFPRWPAIDAAAGDAGTPARLGRWRRRRSGIAIGVAVAFVLEAFALAAQILGLQAGYAYASTIDPNTQADSGVLLVFAQLMAGLLFFALGLDREVLRLFARSLETHSAGHVPASPASAGDRDPAGRRALFAIGVAAGAAGGRAAGDGGRRAGAARAA